MNLRYFISAAGGTAIVFFTMFVACEITDQGSLTNGKLKVELTGEAGDYDSVYVDIQEVRIKSKDLYHKDLSDGEEKRYKDNKGWTTVNDNPVRLNLLEYLNGKTIQVGNEEMEAGIYDELRFILGDDNAVVINGKSHALEVSSEQQSGIPLKINAEIRDGKTYNLLIDFDAGRSIVEANGGRYILNPVMSAANLDENGH